MFEAIVQFLDAQHPEKIKLQNLKYQQRMMNMMQTGGKRLLSYIQGFAQPNWLVC